MRTRGLWLLIAAAFVLLEVYTLLDGAPGTTFSGQVQALVAAYPVARIGIAVGLAWLAYHWLIDKRQRR